MNVRPYWLELALRWVFTLRLSRDHHQRFVGHEACD